MDALQPHDESTWYPPDDDPDDFYPEDLDCSWCQGEGLVDRSDEDPLWFTPGRLYRCAACGGTGRRVDQTLF